MTSPTQSVSTPTTSTGNTASTSSSTAAATTTTSSTSAAATSSAAAAQASTMVTTSVSTWNQIPPEVQQAMLQGIAITVIGQCQDSLNRIHEMNQEAESQNAA